MSVTGRLPAISSRKERGPPLTGRPFLTQTLDRCGASGNEVTEHFLLEHLGHLVDVLRRPAGDVHAETKAHAREHFLDLVQALPAEVRRAEHLGLGLLDEVA